jgi:branched-chain amino acid transport system substrate-binding protein
MSQKKNWMNCTIVVFTVAALLAITTVTGTAADKKEILIGAPLPLTGMLAMGALEQKWAFEQAVADINKQGGIFVKKFNKKLPVRLVLADDESDPGKAVAAMEKLIKLEKVDALLSGFTTNHIIPTSIIADKYKKYYHTTTCLIPPWKEKKFKWSTLFFFDLGQAAAVPYEVMNSMDEGFRPKKLALLMEDTIDGRAFGGGFKAMADKYGYSFTVNEPMAVGAKDYSSQILKLKTKGVDGIIIFASNGDCVTFVRQMKEVGLNVKYFHGYKGTWAPEFYNALGPDAEGILMDGFWSKDLPNPGAKELGQRFFKEFNKHSVSIGLPYGLCQILWEAIEKAGSLDSAAIKEAVLTHEFKDTVMGDIKYDKDGIAIHLLGGFQWNKGYQELSFPVVEGGWKTRPMLPWNKR